MKRILAVLVVVFCLAGFIGSAFGGSVKGYYRKDGTYVRPHYRSNPDADKSNNYGPSRSQSDRSNPYIRDNDGDDSPNYLDRDDNNNGIYDNYERNQYKKGW
jgi:hypothetical protein